MIHKYQPLSLVSGTTTSCFRTVCAQSCNKHPIPAATHSPAAATTTTFPRIPYSKSSSLLALRNATYTYTTSHFTSITPVRTYHQDARSQSKRTLATMSSKLIPSNPADVMVIRNITPNIVTLSVPFARYGILKVGGRATIVRLTSGTLAVFSPVALTPDVKAKLAELGGKVGYLIAPDIEHHIFLSEWAREYPAAQIIGPEGLPEKRAGQADERVNKDDHFSFVFSAANKNPRDVSEEFAADFEAEYVGAHPNREIVLFYKPEGVLIEADLLFSMPANEQYSKAPEADKKSHPLPNKLWNALLTTEGPAKSHKRMQWHLFSNGNKDRAGYNASVRKIDTWDFKTIIPCHGDVIEGNAKEVFRKIFEWHLNA